MFECESDLIFKHRFNLCVQCLFNINSVPNNILDWHHIALKTLIQHWNINIESIFKIDCWLTIPRLIYVFTMSVRFKTNVFSFTRFILHFSFYFRDLVITYKVWLIASLVCLIITVSGFDGIKEPVEFNRVRPAVGLRIVFHFAKIY